MQDVEKTSQCYDELALQDDTQEIICQLIYSGTKPIKKLHKVRLNIDTYQDE